MEKIKRLIEESGKGSIIPIVKELDYAIEPVEYFAKLSDYGRKDNCILLESAEIITKYGEKSIGTADPCIIVRGKGRSFEIKALNKIGEKILEHIKDRLTFCSSLQIDDCSVRGILDKEKNETSENERLRGITQMDVLRAIIFAFRPVSKPAHLYCGLFGMISYDFIDQFESLPPSKDVLYNDYDYEMVFADNLFFVDHKNNKTFFIANAFRIDEDSAAEAERVKDILDRYMDALDSGVPEKRQFSTIKGSILSDTTEEEYKKNVEKLKSHILDGDIFQAVLSRTIIADINSEELDIYSALKKKNPSPYMFYFRTPGSTLIGASPEKCIAVSDVNDNTGRKIVEIRPIAGTKPRGFIGKKIDNDLDSRYETELKTDAKELAEHTMLIDLARNDVARISVPGTRIVENPFSIEKYSHVLHLVSGVKGILKPELDMFHAYLAAMNMGTLTGAPKIKAMELIRDYEKTRRGFYGGAVGYFTPDGEMDSAIVIRTMKIADKKAYIRVGAGIVHDSIPEKEFIETEKKGKACVDTIREAGGVEYE